MVELLGIVTFQATAANDRREYTEQHIKSFLACFIGAAQYKVGTDLWATERVGMMAPPDFGRYVNKDRFDRIFRYLARGPVGNGEDTDPWKEVRWFVDAFNENRRRTA